MAGALKPFAENYIPTLAFSIVMLSAVLLTLPLLLLNEKLQDWFKKRRESKQKPLNNHLDEEGVDFEVIEVASRAIQVNSCADLTDIYMAVSREIFGDSIDSLTEQSLVFDDTESQATIPDVRSFFYKRPIRNFSTISQLATFPEIEMGTQTNGEYFEECATSAWLPQEFRIAESETSSVKVVTGRAARYQPTVSSNQIICPRRPDDKFNRDPNPCCCPEGSKSSRVRRANSKCVVA